MEIVTSLKVLLFLQQHVAIVENTLFFAILLTNMKFQQINTDTNLDLSWFDDFQLPKFRTAKVIGFEIRDCDSICYTNENGQVINVARATGTDYANRDRIMTSIEANGMQVDVLPPVILKDGTSVDGFTRGAALKQLKMDQWIYLVVDLKEGYDLEDLKDELGLGCNNHSPSKPATIDDFKVRLRQWIQRQDATPTIQECVDWWNSIPHSFSQKVVQGRCEDVLNAIHSAATMESYDVEKARVKAAEILKNKLSGNEVILPINYNNKSNDTYLKRSFIQAMEAVSVGKKVIPIGMVNNVPAHQADQARSALRRDVAKLNKVFRAVAEKYNSDPEFELFTLEGFIPQIIGQENPNDLVK